MQPAAILTRYREKTPPRAGVSDNRRRRTSSRSRCFSNPSSRTTVDRARMPTLFPRALTQATIRLYPKYRENGRSYSESCGEGRARSPKPSATTPCSTVARSLSSPLVAGSTKTKSLPALSREVPLLAERPEMCLLEAFVSLLRYSNYWCLMTKPYTTCSSTSPTHLVRRCLEHKCSELSRSPRFAGVTPRVLLMLTYPDLRPARPARHDGHALFLGAHTNTVEVRSFEWTSYPSLSRRRPELWVPW